MDIRYMNEPTQRPIHRGFVMLYEWDRQEDNRKKCWIVITPDGEQIECPVGTYDDDGREVRAWIDAGMPPHQPVKHLSLVARLKREVIWWVSSRREWREYRRECVRRAGILRSATE